jgi:hypothetical protein
MNDQRKLVREIDGQRYASCAMILLIAAGAAYSLEAGVTEEGRAKGLATVKEILRCACIAGFKKADILETLLARDEVSERVKALAIECVDSIEQSEFFAALARCGFLPSEGV